MKQTAVEFLEEKIRYYISNDDRLYDMFKQAKEMEKEQIEDAYLEGQINWEMNSKQYYNKTFKSE